MNPLLAQHDALVARLADAMIRDRHPLSVRLRTVLTELERQPRDTSLQAAALASITTRLDDSAKERALREGGLPKPTYPEDLPVVQRRDEIKKAIAEHQVVVLCGETGSGKTTQLPKICLELGRGVAGMIGHTQPRRIAARSVAMRIAQELSTPLGHAVGYKVRFHDQTRRETYVKLMTDGILLAEAQADRFLSAYDTIIIDEAHERSLNIDFLLGLLKGVLARRPELKLIITSATIDTQRFAAHFGGAPILEISGRTYPVEVRYRPPADIDDEESEDLAIEDAIVQAADELAREGSGDILVFLAGEREIRETAEALRKHHPPETEILPLFSRLSVDEQMKVFQPHGRRRIVLATNVAETSLTVPGIRYVIDPGLARLSRYNPRNKVQRLPIEPVSQASANQRKGRCGRVGPGVCIRLYSEEDFNDRPPFTDPEVLRTNLAAVILQMKAFGLGNVQDFPFVDPPDYRAVRDGYATLHELGAIDDRNELTRTGHLLARLPVDPKLGRMVLAAVEQDCVEEVLVIASALAVQDPRDRPMEKAAEADAAHAPFKDEQSDFLSYLRLWDAFRDRQKHLSGSKLRKWCQSSFISYVRMREWHDVHSQLKELVGEMGVLRAAAAEQQGKRREQQQQRAATVREGTGVLRRGNRRRRRGGGGGDRVRAGGEAGGGNTAGQPDHAVGGGGQTASGREGQG